MRKADEQEVKFWNGISVGSKPAMGVLGGTSLLPYSLDFSALADGALPSGWTGSTWAIASGVAKNTPTLGVELLTNGNMETGDPPSSWTLSASTLDGVADERTGGAGVQSLEVTGDGGFGEARQAVTLTAGGWYLASLWIKNITTSGRLRTLASAWLVSPAQILTTWTQVFASGLAPGNDSVRLQNQSNGAFIVRYDDVSLKKLTQSALFAYRNLGKTGQNVTGTYGTLTSGCAIGVTANVAVDGSAGLLAVINGTNIRLFKWVGSTWATLIDTTQAPASNKLPQILTARSGADLLVDLKYNGSAVGTQQTVSDAEIVSNTRAGLFSTQSAASIATFAAVANP